MYHSLSIVLFRSRAVIIIIVIINRGRFSNGGRLSSFFGGMTNAAQTEAAVALYRSEETRGIVRTGNQSVSEYSY